MPARPMLLCTVGTSLFSNLARESLPDDVRPLADAYRGQRWDELAERLSERDPGERLCGAEINSIHSLVKNGYAPADAGLFFFHSATAEGRAIATVLTRLYRKRGHTPVEAIEVEDLQGKDPRSFRAHGIRNLTRHICRVVRDRSPTACAINATGGYKAQIAVAVILGQALGIPVYYMYEGFSDIIAFPPLPVALDFELWMRASGILRRLEEAEFDCLPRAELEEDWDDRYESLVVPVTIDGTEYLELSATGQIFHETFRERFRFLHEQLLPPPAAPGRKRAPVLKSDEGHMLAYRGEIERYLRRVTEEVLQVICCRTHYFNPDLPKKNHFKEVRGEVEGVYSNGSFTVKFCVETTAENDEQRAAVVAALNEWLAGRS